MVGMDFSTALERALEYALALARRYEARIFLAHVITSDANVMLAPELMSQAHAEREAAYAFSFAQEHQANQTLLHVVPHADDYSQERMAKRLDLLHV